MTSLLNKHSINNCLVSIVTISRNNIFGLSQTLQSVKEQDYEAIQHIIIDGDSNDGTKEFLQSYQHSKIFTYVSEKDNGISSAFNKGIDRSVGNLIFFLNSGDVLISDKIISEVVSSYLKNKWQFAVGSVVSSDYNFKEVLYSPPRLSAKFLKYFMFLPHQAVFCETSLHVHHKFDESIKTSMDYDVFLRMLKGIKIFYLPIMVAKCEPGGVSSQSRKRIMEQYAIRLKYANTTQDKFVISVLNLLILLKSFLKIISPFAVRL
jgi:glycosyltransferase involved in cell wall biosynthesis